ncbi:MAG TPA: hypothetical protein VGR78_13130 [Verrucomicrobiae bacterium]|nr:hypothetical protein [Verrucomicrobiae bacterium]
MSERGARLVDSLSAAVRLESLRTKNSKTKAFMTLPLSNWPAAECKREALPNPPDCGELRFPCKPFSEQQFFDQDEPFD